jgi:hypothetical protein
MKEERTKCNDIFLIVEQSIFLVLLQNNKQMCRESSSSSINAFLDLLQHVSASHCHNQGVVVSSEAAVGSVPALDLSRDRLLNE